ncbi:unnamed protein product [Amoebophrya sp. A120]|nr:unnamed protein product [Amoebophrya sp. A120]|eukprot:GSA120T00002855001.1
MPFLINFDPNNCVSVGKFFVRKTTKHSQNGQDDDVHEGGCQADEEDVQDDGHEEEVSAVVVFGDAHRSMVPSGLSERRSRGVVSIHERL